jgi:hypothetical protein
VLDLDSSDEDMIATVRSKRISIDRSNEINDDTKNTIEKKNEKRRRKSDDTEGDDEAMKDGNTNQVVGRRKKLSTSAKLALPTRDGAKMARDDNTHQTPEQ